MTNLNHRTVEDEYARRLIDRGCELAQITEMHRRLWRYVALGGIAAAVAIWLALSGRLSFLWVALPLITIVYVFGLLKKNARHHDRVQRTVSFYQLGMARLRGTWQGQGTTGEEFKPKTHIYSDDLDLFGEGSVFEWLCTARTGVGRATLAQWLLGPATYEQVVSRQEAIAELREALDLRGDWASVGQGTLDHVEGATLRNWATGRPAGFPRSAQILAMLLPACSIAALLLAKFEGVYYWGWVIAVFLGVQAAFAAYLRLETGDVAGEISLPSFELSLLMPLVKRLQRERFQSALLNTLHSQLTGASGLSIREIQKLSLLAWLLNLRQSEYFALASMLVLWKTNLAILTERWRIRNQQQLLSWMDSLGQFEALLCLARNYYENPGHTLPVLRPSQSSALFHAEALGHPLIHHETCIACAISLQADTAQLAMVSGSNMSGKSTLLRSVGTNCVLALAGGPVRAARLEMSWIQIACSIAVHDSLLAAKSHFQAEVERLKWVLTVSQTGSTLFLLDEVLGGTNSQDRFFGTKAVIEQLMGAGAIGIVTTHDLTLTELPKELEWKAMNVHFEEYYQDGEMRFDYKMRPGVLTRTNGMNVMAALGLLPVSKTE